VSVAVTTEGDSSSKAPEEDLATLASVCGMFVLRDTDCRYRDVIVRREDACGIAEEVARTGGMRYGPEFIGPRQVVICWLCGFARALGATTPLL